MGGIDSPETTKQNTVMNLHPSMCNPLSIPFPVTAPYRVRADMARLDEGAGHFVVDDELPRYLAAKLELLDAYPGLCSAYQQDDEAGLGAALQRVAALVAAEHPQCLRLSAEGWTLPQLGVTFAADGNVARVSGAPLAELGERAAEHLTSVTGVARVLDALSLSVQEDLVVMRLAARGDEAEALAVCFPSRWDPAEKLGQSFAAIHRPVAHSEALVAAAPRVMQALVHKGPFVRYVWSFTPSPQLSLHPALVEGDTGTDLAAEALTFRVERQTTYALPELARALFTIRIYTAPLAQVATTPERKRVLAEAIRSMDDELLAYKGLEPWRERLLDWLSG